MKKYITSKNILLFSAAILMLIIFTNFTSSLSFPDPKWIIEKGTKINIDFNKSLTQNFVADWNGLSRIEILFASPRKEDAKSGAAVLLQLADNTCSKVIREKSANLADFSSDEAYSFKFSKIPDSSGKEYCLKLTSKTGKTKSKKVEVFTISNPPQSSLSMKNNATGEETKNQSLSMRPAYKNSNIFGDIKELDQRMSQYKPWFLKGFYLYSIVFLFILLTIGILVIFIV
jgi:hypothetical protein